MQCAFCATGEEGLTRSLFSGEWLLRFLLFRMISDIELSMLSHWTT